MSRLARAISHIFHGTLLERLRLEWWKQMGPRRQAWWDSRPGTGKYFEIKIQRRVRMRLYFDSELARMIFCEDFERQERQFLNAFLRPGDIFVDIGANIGLYSLIAASLVGETGKVYAFEPASEAYRRLGENVELNGFRNIFPFKLAFCDEAGNLPFFISEDGYDAWNSFARPVAGSSFSSESVQCETWDIFAERHDLAGKTTMMKIDVEGWETRCLKGAAEVLSRKDAPVLQVEFTDDASRSAGTSCNELYHQLEDLGYEMFVYERMKKDIIPDPVREEYPYLNLIAAKDPDRVRKRIHRNRL